MYNATKIYMAFTHLIAFYGYKTSIRGSWSVGSWQINYVAIVSSPLFKNIFEIEHIAES